MSSIVKKSSHFVPKVKKRVTRKPTVATPPASQVTEDPNVSQPLEIDTNASESVAQALSPPATQLAMSPGENTRGNTGEIASPAASQAPQSQNVLLSYTLSSQPAVKPLNKDSAEPVVDPIQKVPGTIPAKQAQSENVSESDDEYGDNDIFKRPAALVREPVRRRSSVVSPAVGSSRLMSIGGPRRSSVYSSTHSPALGALEGDHVFSKEAPVTIGVPSAKPPKKRGPSFSRPGRKLPRGSVVSIGPVTDTLREEADEADEAENAGELGHSGSRPVGVSVANSGTKSGANSGTILGHTHTSPSKSRTQSDFVVALCPKTNKMRKFRTSAEVASDLPVAPKDLVTSLSSVQQLPRKVKPEDEELYTHISVSADTMSMADLCKPMLQIGTKCETFPLAEEAKVNLLKKKAERREARELARKYRISYKQALRELQRDDVDANADADADADADGGSGSGQKRGFDFERAAREEELAQAATNNLKLAVVDGQLQVDQESVIRAREFAPSSNNRTVELENPFENPITAGSYSRKVHTDPWTKQEMVQFYKALSTWGTDFTFIAQLFPYRTRRQVKNKFTLEEKNQPQLIELALRRKLPPNMDEFLASASSAVKSLKTVDDFNRELADLKRDHEAHIRDINTERERAIKEDLEANRKREIEIRTGSKPMTKAERSRMIRQNEVVVGDIEDVKRTREQLDAGGGH